MTAPSGFYGKYRGVVSDINDPLMTMRIKASVPDVYGDNDSGWALPCAPFGGDQVGMLALPKVGAGVWIEFEHGDPDYPVWSGCWWGSLGDLPSDWLTPPYQKLMIVTPAGHSITVDDTPGAGGITLETATGAKIAMSATSLDISLGTGGGKVAISATGLEISNGQGASIKMTGPKVSVNDGALDVT